MIRAKENQNVPFSYPTPLPRLANLARSTSWDTRAIAAGFSTGDCDVGPGPVAARAASAENVHVDTAWGDGSGDTADGQVGDWDSGGWRSSWGTVLVILLDDLGEEISICKMEWGGL